MRKLISVFAALLASTVPAFAQSPGTTVVEMTPPGIEVLADFHIIAAIDAPATMQMVSRSQPLIIGGWTFETRSGLQPATQRVGDIAVRFVNVNTGEAYVPAAGTVTTTFGERRDVFDAYRWAYPALGTQAGLSIVVRDLPPPNLYRLEVQIDTFDYAGRVIIVTIPRSIIITQ